MTTARTKAATTIAFFGTRILTQCIPGLVSGGSAKSKRYAKAADRKRKGYRKPPLRRPVSSTSVWERLAGSDARVSEYAIHSGIREGGHRLAGSSGRCAGLRGGGAARVRAHCHHGVLESARCRGRVGLRDRAPRRRRDPMRKQSHPREPRKVG